MVLSIHNNNTTDERNLREQLHETVIFFNFFVMNIMVRLQIGSCVSTNHRLATKNRNESNSNRTLLVRDASKPCFVLQKRFFFHANKINLVFNFLWTMIHWVYFISTRDCKQDVLERMKVSVFIAVLRTRVWPSYYNVLRLIEQAKITSDTKTRKTI